MLKNIVLFVFASSLPCVLSAQFFKSDPKIGGQAGIGFSAANPDYGSAAIKGIAFYGNLDVGAHLGITGEINDLKLFTPQDIGESTYLYGVRYQFTKARFHPYAKALFGLGSFSYQQGTYRNPTSLRFTTFAFGGGVDYFLPGRKINIRIIDLEYQWLPSFSPNGLTPFAGTVGAAYRF